MLNLLRSVLRTIQKKRQTAEHAYEVSVSDEGVSCQRPDGQRESVRWADLRAVIVETTDRGPFVPDIYWILVGEHGGCVIPQGATGESAMLV